MARNRILKEHDMTADIHKFTGNTLLDLEADDVLEAAKTHLESAVIIGWTNDGDLYVASTTSKTGEIFLLLELTKDALLEKLKDGD
jgi:uncharacterized protein with WD repeat